MENLLAVAQYTFQESIHAPLDNACSALIRDSDCCFVYAGFGSQLRFRVRTTFPSTLYESYSYDAVGNLYYKTDRRGQRITYLYDNFDRLQYKYLPNTVTYTYDKAGHLTKVVDGSSNWQFAYDHIGRLTQTQTVYSFLTGRSFTVSYAYDAAGNRTSMTDPANGVSNYVYDSLNRLTDLTDFNSNHFGFGYDALSRRNQLTRPNGVSTNYAYDNLSRLLSVLHQVGLTTIDGASYTYDNAGNRTSKLNQLNAVTENYTYGQIYQLTQVVQGLNTTEAYTYDAVGNRLSSLGVSPYTYNSSNQLLSTPTTTYTYDSDGNTATKVDSSGTTTYAWDYENRLTSVTLPGSGGTVTFKYDPFGRRIQKVSPSGTTNYIYDGANTIEEVDASGTVLARYAQGAGIDEPLDSATALGTRYYDADGLGSITSLADISGNLTDTYVSDSFGKSVTSTGATRNPFRFTARDLDAETGLMYYRARYYDPAVGRFVSEDPAGFGGGINFYAYVKNDPIDFIDPTGLKCWQSSPWTEIPSMWGPDGPKPYLTITDGVNWVKTGWSYASLGLVPDYTHCVCQWVASHTRVRKFYRVTVKEQAQFTCDCTASTEYRTRERTKEYEVDGPGMPSWPTQYTTTTGPTFQLSDTAGSHPKNKNNVICGCPAPAP